MNPERRDDEGSDDLESLVNGKGEIALPPDEEARVEELDVFARGGEVDLSGFEVTLKEAPHETPTTAAPEEAVTVPPPEWPASEPIEGMPHELARHPRYRLLRLLGQGGMGAVYQALHRMMDRVVALKVIHRCFTASAAAVERFRREVTTAARLHHPNIVSAFDAEHAGGVHFLVMEYVEGCSLAEYLREKGRLEVREACGYIRQAALGLQYAHEKGMVHRDIKPDNLMRTPAGQIKILDFGLARFAIGQALAEARTDPVSAAGDAPGRLTLAGALMGTPDYIAPEQATDSTRVDIRADIYSLGCTLYQLLTGQLPFPGGEAMDKVMRHTTDPPAPLADLRPDLPAGLVTVVEKMMAKNPAQRYQTPAEVAAALEPFLTPPAPPAAALPTRAGTRWWPWLAGAAGLAALAVLWLLLR